MSLGRIIIVSPWGVSLGPKRLPNYHGGVIKHSYVKAHPASHMSVHYGVREYIFVCDNTDAVWALHHAQHDQAENWCKWVPTAPPFRLTQPIEREPDDAHKQRPIGLLDSLQRQLLPNVCLTDRKVHYPHISQCTGDPRRMFVLSLEYARNDSRPRVPR